MDAQIKKTTIILADGRKLIYFDDNIEYVEGKKNRETKDERPLKNQYEHFYNEDGSIKEENLPQMRYDILMDEWIPMATHRMNRTFMPPKEANPLAPKNKNCKQSDSEIPSTDYDVVVFENRFPSFLTVPGAKNEEKIFDKNKIFKSKPANGKCEVICFGPKIDQPLVEMGKKRMRTIIEAWADRTKNLYDIEQIKQVYCFENHGQAIGVTLQHPHGQIYAYPYVTPRMKKIVENTEKYYEKHKTNLFDDLIKGYEQNQKELIICQTQNWILYVPYAAKWPLQMHLMAKRQVSTINCLNDEEKNELSELYLTMIKIANKFFRKHDGTYIEVPYISSWNQAPKGNNQIRLFCDFFSFQRSENKIKYLAGSESGMGAWISDTSPEKIAFRLKQIYDNEINQ